MPYKAKGQCIYKKDTGAKVGCTKGSVSKYLAALHANADESVELKEVRKYVRKVLFESQNKSLKNILDSDEAYSVLDSSKATGTMWTQGGCAILAFALNKVYGYPVYVIYDNDLKQADHFVVKTPHNTYVDYRGAKKDIIKSFKEDEMLWNKNFSLIPYKKGMNISDIVIDDKASQELAELIRNGINTKTNESLIAGEENSSDYKKWKRKNVTLRGIANTPEEYNGVGSISLGDGFYTASLGNKEMARKYGKVYFVVNGRPKHPLIFNSVNVAEIWLHQNLYSKNFKGLRDFNAHTTIETEVQKLGYDGIEIKGREMVNFKPENIKYFKTERELIDYYDNFVKNSIQEINIIEQNEISANDNFLNWFNGSKVVSKNGQPLVVYHGTGKKFSKFNLKNAPQPIIWFTSNKNTIESGNAGAAGKGHIMDLYASVKNPAGWDEYEKYGLGQLKSLGYDGAILSDSDGTITGFVFEPSQLKSIRNKGDWNTKNKSIFKEDLKDL